MDIPLDRIAPAGKPRDGKTSPTAPGDSLAGRVDDPLPGVGGAHSGVGEPLPGVGKPLPGVGEAPLPPVGFAQLRELNQIQVIEWLDRIGYFKEFTIIDMALSKQEFLKLDLTGAVLLERGPNIDALLPILSLGKALRLNTIIKRIYLDAGIFSPSFANNTLLTIT